MLTRHITQTMSNSIKTKTDINVYLYDAYSLKCSKISCLLSQGCKTFFLLLTKQQQTFLESPTTITKARGLNNKSTTTLSSKQLLRCCNVSDILDDPGDEPVRHNSLVLFPIRSVFLRAGLVVANGSVRHSIRKEG